MKHRCHWPTCEKTVSPRLWGCRAHWYTLPHDIRARINETYVDGQEITKTPSSTYMTAARAAQDWISANYPTEEVPNG